MQNIVERAKQKWNSQADEFNKWDNLGLDEILQLIIAEEKFTSTNSKSMPCQHRYTVKDNPVVGAKSCISCGEQV